MDPVTWGALLGFAGAALGAAGGVFGEKIRGRAHVAAAKAEAAVDSDATASAVLSDVMNRQGKLETKIQNLESTIYSLSWRYFLALKSLVDHRDGWPESAIDQRPEVHPTLAVDLEHGPDFYKERLRNAEQDPYRY